MVSISYIISKFINNISNKIILLTMTQPAVYKIPKIKKSQILSKLLIDPADIRKGLPESSLPQLTDKGMILSLTPQKVPLAKLNPEGTLKICMKYYAQTIELIDRYVEVAVIDEYDDEWVGTLFGFTVRGTGGHGTVRGCKVTGIQGQTIIAEFLLEGENESWKKFVAKVEEILSKKK